MDQGTVLAVTIPTLAVLVGMLVNGRQLESLKNELKADIGGLRGEMNARFQAVDARFQAVDARFDAAHQALLRVEGVLDARLRHLEEERDR